MLILQIKNALNNTKVLDFIRNLSIYLCHLITKMMPMITMIITLAI